MDKVFCGFGQIPPLAVTSLVCTSVQRILTDCALLEQSFGVNYAHTVYISLGSNLESEWGGPEANLAKALAILTDQPWFRVDGVSAIYMTEPQNLREQPWFANQVARLLCLSGVSAERMLALLHQCEACMGRRRDGATLRFGPRIIDLDLLLFDDEQRAGPELFLPHPRLPERAFVLAPLCDLAPDLRIPGRRPGDDTPRLLLKKLAYRLEGKRIYQ